MPERTPPPPFVKSFEGLLQFRHAEKDSIVLAIDFECADHNQGSATEFDRMSEVGLACFDPRDHKSSGVSTSTSSNAALEELGTHIRARHTVTTRWKHITEETCHAWHHRRPNNPVEHKARPYHCAFARSGFRTQEAAIDDIKALVTKLCIQNQTEEEAQNSTQRFVRIIFWAAHTEASIFQQAGLDLHSVGPDIKVWDFQLWSPFGYRFKTNQGVGAERAFKSLGALGLTQDGVVAPLHNATNDTVAQLLGFLRFFVMTKEECNSWMAGVDLAPITMGWVEPDVYQFNLSKSPKPEVPERKNRRQGGTAPSGLQGSSGNGNPRNRKSARLQAVQGQESQVLPTNPMTVNRMSKSVGPDLQCLGAVIRVTVGGLQAGAFTVHTYL